MPDPIHLTERQAKWFESVRNGLERATGRSLAQWAEIARTCPEQSHRARLAWMKAHHGLGQNHASMVLNAAFPPEASWSKPDALARMLWHDPKSADVFAAVRAIATALPDVITGQRKGFTAFSRKFQFAAARPLKTGGVMLGLALDPADHADLVAPGRESWSERLKSCIPISHLGLVNQTLADLLHQAWDCS